MIYPKSGVFLPKGGVWLPKSPPFDPAVLFSGGYTGMFYDFSRVSSLSISLDGSTPAQDLGDPIRFVSDLSGTGNHLNSMFTTTAPVFTDAGGVSGAFYASGAGERLLRNSSYLGAPLGLSGVNEITVAIALTTTTHSAALRAHNGGVGSSNDYIDVGPYGGGSIRNYSAGLSAQNATVNNTGFSDVSGAPLVMLMEKVGTEGRHYRNGTLVETDLSLNDPWSASFNAAIDLRNYGGFVFAVVVINRALSAIERANLHAWLMERAGLA